MSYAYKRAITVDHSKTPSTLTNFPFVVAGTLASLATIANGGRMQNAFDIAFFSDASLTVALKFERVLLDSTTGEHYFVVKIPSYSSSVDTVIYMAYGDAAVTTDQQDAANTWTSARAVFHGSATDVTGNGNSMTPTAAPTTVAGLIGNARRYDGTTQYDTVTMASALNYPFTFTALYKVPASTVGVLIGLGGAGVTTSQDEMTPQNTGALRYLTAGGAFATTASSLIPTNTWMYSAIRGLSNTNRYAKVNQVAATNSTASTTNTGTKTVLRAGARANPTAGTFLGVDINELRIWSVDVGDDWLVAEDNSLRGIATFYAIGSETSAITNVLAITQQPTAIASGAAFSPVTTVEVRTNGTSVDASSTLSITATILSGAGTLIGTVTRAAVAGVATFTGLGATIPTTGACTIRYSGAGYSNVDSSSFTVSAPVITVEILSQPDSVKQGVAFTVIARRKVDGVVDPTYVGNMTMSQIGGTGTLTSAAGLTKAAVAGVTTWTDLVSSVGELSPKVLQTALPTGQTATLGDLYVRGLAYGTKGVAGIAPLGAVRDPYTGVLMPYAVQVGGACSASAPAHIVLNIPGSGHYLGNYSPSTFKEALTNSSIGHLSATTSWGAGMLAEKSTSNYITLGMVAGAGTDIEKLAYRNCLPLVWQQMIDDGYWLFCKYIVGYSTGGIEIGDHLHINGRKLDGVWMMDAGVGSWHLTGWSAILQTFNGFGTYATSTRDYSGDDDVFFAITLGPDWKNSGCSIACFKSSTTFPMPDPVTGMPNPSGRDQFSPLGKHGNDGWLQAMEAAAGHTLFTQTIGSSSVVVAPPSSKYVYQNITSFDHSTIQGVLTGSNFTLAKDWLFAQRNTNNGIRRRRILSSHVRQFYSPEVR